MEYKHIIYRPTRLNSTEKQNIKTPSGLHAHYINIRIPVSTIPISERKNNLTANVRSNNESDWTTFRQCGDIKVIVIRKIQSGLWQLAAMLLYWILRKEQREDQYYAQNSGLPATPTTLICAVPSNNLTVPTTQII